MSFTIDKVVEFILAGQNEDGSFNTYELYPVVKPLDDWSKLPDSSPFISANILHALTLHDDLSIKPALEKAGRNLWLHKERGGYWRFWPINSKQHPVALDVDDTAICSFVLQKLGYSLNNKRILNINTNARGYFNTWIKPSCKTFFTNPMLHFGLLQDYKLSKPTVAAGEFSFDDYEPAVAANVLLYLGSNKHTDSCIQLVINDILSHKLKLEFYADEAIVYYHIARAYANGVDKLVTLKEFIVSHLETRFAKHPSEEMTLHKLLAASALAYFKSDSSTAAKLVDEVGGIHAVSNNWKCEPYFASKDRNFLAGSPELTAAFFLEAYIVSRKLDVNNHPV